MIDTGLAGRVAVVTGAGSGIGLATARMLAGQGCSVVAADLRREAVEPLEAELGAVAVAGDVSDPAGAGAIVAAARDSFGCLDVLVCCAGVYETSSYDSLDAAGWDRVLDVNLRGSFLCAQAAMPVMGENGWGRIVLLSSIAALTGGVAAGPAYVASKAGVMGLTRSLAHAGGPLGITVNCLNPGIIETPMTAAIDADERVAMAARTPVRRNGRPEDVAGVIVFLASEAAGFVNGAHLSVNGGLYMD